MKTTTFFEIGFLPAYLLSLNREATSAELEKVHKLVKYFGLAFQISDDFDDIEQDKNRVNSEYNPNIVCKYGLEEGEESEEEEEESEEEASEQESDNSDDNMELPDQDQMKRDLIEAINEELKEGEQLRKENDEF